MTPPVFAFAFGEASFELIDQWSASGQLPAFARLRERGCFGPLHCHDPFVTPQLWSTVLTGVNAGRHGVFDFWQRGANGRFEEIDRRAIREPCLWDYLARGGRSVGLFNVPLTYPPPRVPGYVIAGQDAPGASSGVAEPRRLYGDIVGRFGSLPFKEIFPGGREKSDYLTLFDVDAARRSAVLEFLAREHAQDFQLYYNSAIAMAQHYFWRDMAAAPGDPYRDTVLNAFRGMDALLGRTLEAAPADARVIVFSECGAGPLVRGVDLNQWLASIGMLKPREKVSGAAIAADRNAARGLRHWAQRRLPLGAQAALNRHLKPLKRWVQMRSEFAHIDLSRTRAFARGKEGNLFVNLKGREPQGVVNPGAEYEAVRDELIAALLALRDPSSSLPPVTRAMRAEEVFEGPHLAAAPDVIVEWRNGEYMASEQRQFGGDIFCERWREYMSWPTSGSHRSKGIFFAAGPGIRRGARVDDVRLADVLPTLLHASGVPLPPGIEGRIAPDVFSSPGGGT